MTEPYAVSIGEALLDLLEGECDGQPVYRPMAGGSPMNVAVGLARLGDRVEFLGSFGNDPLAGRLRGFLADAGVGLTGSVTAATPTTLALTAFAGSEPHFSFYGSPHSFGLLDPERLDRGLVEQAKVVHFGSISLLEPPVLEAVRLVCAIDGPARTLDPNVRPDLLRDVDGYRALMDELYPHVDLVKLSADDAGVLYPGTPEAAAFRVQAAGAGTVVVTLGPAGALLLHDDELVHLPNRDIQAVDATGGGDATMAGLIHGLLVSDPPVGFGRWQELLRFALDVAALTVLAPGGATAMPTLEAVRTRWGTAP
jgi:sugar/nucleoside kinase (ribokinase family)